MPEPIVTKQCFKCKQTKPLLDFYGIKGRPSRTQKRCKICSKQRYHGLSGTKFYLRWQNLKNRCYSPNFPDYKYYGARGICMCKRWKNSFSAFRDDMIATYKEGLTLDRIDNNGPYSLENCRWATRAQQSQNRNYCRQITIKGEIRPLWQWLQIFSIKRSTYSARHYTYGWPIIKAITKPVRKYKYHNHSNLLI